MTHEQSVDVPEHPLVTAIGKKTSIAWIEPVGKASTALWCVWHDGDLHVVCGEGEQDNPGLVDGGSATVTLRGDHNGRVVDYQASVQAISADSPKWEDTAPIIAGKRLNSPSDTIINRWSETCVIYRLALVDETVKTGDELGSDSQSAPVRPSEAARPTRKPYRLHRVKRRKTDRS